MPIGSFTSNRNINATTPHATPITVCQRPPRRRPLHPGPAVVACRKSLARKESRRGLSHPRSSPHTQRIAESKRAAPYAIMQFHDPHFHCFGSVVQSPALEAFLPHYLKTPVVLLICPVDGYQGGELRFRLCFHDGLYLLHVLPFLRGM